jgi:2-amino-4-hydroxy-6-hydroxymethyldihydropteridine diphosphokinase
VAAEPTPHVAVVAVGSNVDPERHVAAARVRLAAEQSLRGESAWRRTVALGPPDADGQATLRPDMPAYLNGAFLVATDLDASAFRAYLHDLEARLGRQRCSDRYAPRTIDLDLAVWDGEVVDPDVHRRDFLRAAVGELLPELGLA